MTLNFKVKFCFDECRYDQYQYLSNEVFQAQNLGLTAAKGSLVKPHTWQVSPSSYWPVAMHSASAGWPEAGLQLHPPPPHPRMQIAYAGNGFWDFKVEVLSLKPQALTLML